MRLTYFALAAVAAVSASCNTVLAVTITDQAQLPSTPPSDLVERVSAHDDGYYHRTLRGGKTVIADEENDDDNGGEVDSVDEEESGGTALAEKFAEWHAGGKTADDIYRSYNLASKELKAHNTGKIKLRQSRKYNEWLDYVSWLKRHGYE
ncbi:unnamed protein product [Phytophthora lilii]|uniref:RxLR effector protein n=1 Tax=Phytophthora lilii TaxID=2077276 RepID=A0A9W6YHT5_9STRA|nr:unnamed protein product [Phytophthora lilii]